MRCHSSREWSSVYRAIGIHRDSCTQCVGIPMMGWTSTVARGEIHARYATFLNSWWVYEDVWTSIYLEHLFGGFHQWGIPQWMVDSMEIPIKMNDLGVTRLLGCQGLAQDQCSWPVCSYVLGCRRKNTLISNSLIFHTSSIFDPYGGFHKWGYPQVTIGFNTIMV